MKQFLYEYKHSVDFFLMTTQGKLLTGKEVDLDF